MNRILFIVTHPMTASILLRGQLRYLLDAGFEVGVASAPGRELEEVGEREGAKTFALPFAREIAPTQDTLALTRLVTIIRRFRPQIVHASTPKAGLLGMLAAKVCKVRHRLYLIRGLRLETSVGFQRRLLLFCERTAIRCAHRVFCVSPSLKERCLKLGLSKGKPLAVVGPGSSNGVDVGRFRPRTKGESESAQLREALGISPPAPVVGFVGRLTGDKGIGDLLEAMERRLFPVYPEARLLLVGDYEEGDPISATARRRISEHPKIVATGFVRNTAPYYRLMDVLAFPSYREGFPNAPLEAAASGIPTAGYEVTGTVDAVVSGETGTLVPPGDIAGFGQALLSYLQEPDLARLHGEAGRMRAVESFSSKRIWEAWADLYRRMLANHEQ